MSACEQPDAWNPDLLSVLDGNIHISVRVYYPFPTYRGLGRAFTVLVSHFTFNCM